MMGAVLSVKREDWENEMMEGMVGLERPSTKLQLQNESVTADGIYKVKRASFVV